MIHFKSHSVRPGLSLIEAMISIAIITLVMSPIFVINSQILRSVSRASQNMDRMLQAKTFLIRTAFAMGSDATDQTTFEKKISLPKTFMRYERKKLSKESALGAFPDLYAHQVSLRWQDQRGTPRTDTLVSFVYQPVVEREKK